MASPPSTSQPLLHSKYKLNFHSLSQPKVEESDDFLPWLERKAGAEISSALSIGKSAYGTSLFASKSMTAGDCVLKVPYSVQLAPDNLVPELKDLLSDGVGDAAKLATVVLFEQRMGNYSGWAPYIRWLPRPEEMHCTALKNFPKMSKSITYKDFMHVYALVTSRAWGSTTKGYSLIPFADFLNHDGTSGSIVLSDDNKHFSEALIRYGKFSNATLLLDVGLHFHTTSTTRLRSRSGSGKGKGIPQSLHSFARVLCCASPQELSDLAKEAAEHDGRLAQRPLTNSSREIEAHQMLLSKVTQLAEDCDASIKSLGPVSSPVTCERLSIGRQMAQDLLNGELRILKSASVWLRNYCNTLTTTDCHR